MEEESSSTPRADAYLRERGITKETIAQHRIRLFGQSPENRVLPSHYQEYLHFDNWDREGKLKLHEIIEESIWFPCRDEHGCVESMIVRAFPPLPGKNGSGDAKFITPKDGNGYPFIPSTTWEVKGKPHVPLLLTEGPTKALAAVQAGAYAIGLGGVWMATEKVNESGAIGLRSVLQLFAFTGRTVYIAFDADFESNPRVRQALIRTAFLLSKAGAAVKIPTWPITSGKGLDDYLIEL
jgi:DNA primase